VYPNSNWKLTTNHLTAQLFALGSVELTLQDGIAMRRIELVSLMIINDNDNMQQACIKKPIGNFSIFTAGKRLTSE